MFSRGEMFRILLTAAFASCSTLTVRAQSQTFDEWWNLGNKLYAANQFAEAANALSHAVELDAQAAKAWGLLGLCEFETRDYKHSLDHMEKALNLGLPGQDQLEGVLRYHNGLLLAHEGEPGKALDQYLWFVKKGVVHNDLLMAIGVAALYSREFPENIAPEKQDLYLSAGKAAYLSMAGARTEAQQAFEDLITRYPATPYVHYLYASFLAAADLGGSMEQMRREVEISPDNGSANAMLARLLMLDDDFKNAGTYAEKAEEESPGSPMSEYVYGRSLIERSDLTEGIKHLKTAERLQPQDLMNHIALAFAYSKAERPVEARRERQIALQLAQNKDARQ